MSVTVDCGEGKHGLCTGWSNTHYLVPQMDGERFECACRCHHHGATGTAEPGTARGTAPARDTVEPPSPGAHSQKLAALKKANRIRDARATFKTILHGMAPEHAAVEVTRVILEPPYWMATWKIGDLLHRIPKVGDARVTRWLVETKTSAARTLEALTDRQRMALVDALAGTLRNPLVTCACGCGEKFTRLNGNGNPRRFVHAHNNRLRKKGRAA